MAGETPPKKTRAPAETPGAGDEAQVGGATPGRTPTVEEVELLKGIEAIEAMMWPEDKDSGGPEPIYTIKIHVFEGGFVGLELECFETGDWRLLWLDSIDEAVNKVKELVEFCEEEPPAESEIYQYEPDPPLEHDFTEGYEREDIYPPARGEEE